MTNRLSKNLDETLDKANQERDFTIYFNIANKEI